MKLLSLKNLTIFLLAVPLFMSGCSGLKSAGSQTTSASAKSWFGSLQLGEAGVSSTGIAVTTDAVQNVIVTGYTSANLSTCAGVSSACSGASQGANDLFITKYDRRGLWVWTTQLGETSHSIYPSQILTDSSMNIFVVGTTDGNLLSCNGVSSSCTGAAQGSLDLFIVKYNANGIWQWTQQLGETSHNTAASAFAADASGHLVIVGQTSGNLVSCAGVSASCTGSSQGSIDTFIAKYDSAGTYVSMYQIGETGKSISGSALQIDGSGAIFIGGETSGNVPSCSGVSASCTGSSQGTKDYFISKYDSSLTWLWSQQLGETGKQTILDSLALDTSGNLLVAGDTAGLLESCAGVSASCTGSAASSTGDIFVSKYSTTGTYQWLRQLDSAAGANTASVIADSSNNIYVSGTAYSNLVSCNGVSANCSGAATGAGDAFLLKYNSAGTWIFTRQVGETSQTFTPYGLASDSLGEPLMVGYGTGNLQSSSCNGTSPVCTGNSTGTTDYFVIKYDLNGSIQ